MNSASRRSAKTRGQVRRAATAVEFALTAPILFLLLFAGIEFARANIVLHSLENAAYEGARRGIPPGANASDCQSAAQLVLNVAAVTDSTITVTPATITSDTETITVSVQAPMNLANGYVTPQFYLGKTLQSSITLTRERL